MENAAKALTIAGGVLIAIIVIATLWYSFQQWGLFPSAKDEGEEVSQLVAFNKQFESYHKQNLYGTDVITVINMAIANNEKYGITAQTDDPYYINVIFTTITPADGHTIITKVDNEQNRTTTDEPNEKAGLPAGTYELKINKDLIKMYNLCSTEAVKRTERKEDKGKTLVVEEIYPPTTEFRLKYFTCTGIEYNNQNGRVSKMIFREIDSNTELKDI